MYISLDGVTSVPDPQSIEFDTGERTTLGKDAFLKLLVAQMATHPTEYPPKCMSTM